MVKLMGEEATEELMRELEEAQDHPDMGPLI